MRVRVLLVAALAAALLAAVVPAGGAAQTSFLSFTSLHVVIMTGAEEAPGPGDPDGFGVAIITIDTRTDTVCWFYSVLGIDLPAIGAHIHVAPRGEPGPIVVPLSNADATGRASGCIVDEDADAIEANPSAYYVNVHTVPFPGGAVRGQLG